MGDQRCKMLSPIITLFSGTEKGVLKFEKMPKWFISNRKLCLTPQKYRSIYLFAIVMPAAMQLSDNLSPDIQIRNAASSVPLPRLSFRSSFNIYCTQFFLKIFEECFLLALGRRRGGRLRCYHKPNLRTNNCPFFSSLPKYKVMLTVVSEDKVFAAMKTFFSEIFTQPLDQNIPSQNCSRSTQEPIPRLFSKNIENNLCHGIVPE